MDLKPFVIVLLLFHVMRNGTCGDISPLALCTYESKSEILRPLVFFTLLACALRAHSALQPCLALKRCKVSPGASERLILLHQYRMCELCTCHKLSAIASSTTQQKKSLLCCSAR